VKKGWEIREKRNGEDKERGEQSNKLVMERGKSRGRMRRKGG